MATDIETQDHVGRRQTLEDKAIVTDLEHETLRRIPDKLPKIALLILAVEVSRRFHNTPKRTLGPTH